jgi:hypothetical protein
VWEYGYIGKVREDMVDGKDKKGRKGTKGPLVPMPSMGSVVSTVPMIPMALTRKLENGNYNSIVSIFVIFGFHDVRGVHSTKDAATLATQLIN